MEVQLLDSLYHWIPKEVQQGIYIYYYIIKSKYYYCFYYNYSYGKFPVGTGTESREVTLRKAKLGITHLCQQLFLSNHCIETAHNFFKMALSRQLTRGRRNTHIYAACVYITCRTEGTSRNLD